MHLIQLKKSVMIRVTTMENKGGSYPFLAEEIPDLNVVLLRRDASIDRKMSIHKSHLVPITFGDASDEVLDMAKSSSNGSHCFARAKPSFNLKLSTFFDDLEV